MTVRKTVRAGLKRVRRTLRGLMHLCGVIVLFMGAFWWRYDADGPYFIGFMVFPVAALLLILWAINGFGGAERWEQNASFILPWIMLIAWAFVSQGWARFPQPAAGFALQTVFIGLVIVAFATDGPPLPWTASGIGAAAIISSAVGLAQAALQRPIGLGQFGEYALRANSKPSTLNAGGLVFLRPYGLTVHPNVLGGFLMIGLLVLLGAWLRGYRPERNAVQSGRILVALFVGLCAGWFTLLLTFSRAAWLGLVIGGIALVALLIAGRVRLPWRRVILLSGAFCALGVVFILLYRPFVLGRSGLSGETSEQRSFADRALFIGYTERMIAGTPIFGVGNGMNDWESAQMIVVDPLKPDLVALPVHSVPLLILSELGLIGFGLWLMCLAGGGFSLLRYIRQGGRDPLTLAFFAAFVGLFATSALDFYMWRHLPVVLLWYGGLGCALTASAPKSEPIRGYQTSDTGPAPQAGR